MKQIRIIRISFFVCAVCAVLAFWSGFYFGEMDKDREQTLTASQLQEPVKTGTEEKKTDSGKKTTADGPYYLKAAGEYLSVYYGTSREFYFESDVKVSELPQALQETARENEIAFSTLEDVYSFLENYSS